MCNVDYTTSKHALLGFMRSMVSILQPKNLPIRINATAPHWTETGLVPREIIEAAGGLVQTAEQVAPSVVVLMADQARNGQMVYSEGGRFWEIEEAVLLPAADSVGVAGTLSLDQTLKKVLELAGASADREKGRG